MKLKVFLAFLAMVLCAIAQGVTDKVAPDGNAPVGCNPSADIKFEISVVPIKTMAKKDMVIKTRNICSASSGNLVLTLADGVLTDAQNRTGYIASNYQFQFDSPPQAGAIYTAGFSACANGSIALGASAVFWQCASGTFYNLYDRWWAAQCEPVVMVVLPCREQAGVPQPSIGASQTVVGSQVVTTTVVIPLSDGQPQVVTTTSVVYLCQIGDGQIQAHATPCIPTPTGNPVSQISDGQIQGGIPVTQISDGQIQVTTGIPVTQISDGQVQVTTGIPVTQISDGQVQVTTGIPASQISDGQVQVTPGPVSQLSDGQVIQGTPVSELSDGQVVQGTVTPQAAGSQQQTTAATPAVTPTAGEGGPFAVPTEAPPASGAAAAFTGGDICGRVMAMVMVQLLVGVGGGMGWF